MKILSRFFPNSSMFYALYNPQIIFPVLENVAVLTTPGIH